MRGHDPYAPGAMWEDRGKGSQRIRILDLLNDGTLRVERIAGAPAHALNIPFVVTFEQLEGAFEPSGGPA